MTVLELFIFQDPEPLQRFNVTEGCDIVLTDNEKDVEKKRYCFEVKLPVEPVKLAARSDRARKVCLFEFKFLPCCGESSFGFLSFNLLRVCEAFRPACRPPRMYCSSHLFVVVVLVCTHIHPALRKRLAFTHLARHSLLPMCTHIHTSATRVHYFSICFYRNGYEHCGLVVVLVDRIDTRKTAVSTRCAQPLSRKTSISLVRRIILN